MITFFLTGAAFIFLYNFDIVTIDNLILESYIMNFSIPVIYLFIMLYMDIKFSGCPFISEVKKRQFYQFKKLYIIWGFCRLTSGVTDVLFTKYKATIFLIFTN